MSNAKLPERASLEYLKKLAKDRLRDLRSQDPETKLAAAQQHVAQDHGFSSWRALKAEIDARRAPTVTAFFAACRGGDVEKLRRLLEDDASLVHERNEEGTTGLHLAVGHVAALRLLLERGADPNARDVGDNAYALHFAAGQGKLESVRALLDAGADVHGFGDVHRRGVIGWATDAIEVPRDVVALLLERGARHHLFSAIAVADPDLVQELVENDPSVLRSRRSRFEQGQTALHYTIVPPDGLLPRKIVPQYDMLDLLIELGAELESVDDKGRTVLMSAILRGDREAMRRLKAAGAVEPNLAQSDAAEDISDFAASVTSQLTPMLGVVDMAVTLAFYTSIGFSIVAKNENDGVIDWAKLSFGKSEIMVTSAVAPSATVSLWFGTKRLEDLFAALKAHQLRRAHADLSGTLQKQAEVCFVEELYTAFYGTKQFSIRDPNGFVLVFCQAGEG